MYQDPTKLRSNIIKIRLNDAEAALIDALVGYTGEQKASLLREMLLDQAMHVLHGDSDFAGAGFNSQRPQSASFSA